MSASDGTPYRYRVRHLTRYAYGGEVMHSHQMLRLTPRAMPHQTTLSQQVTITPQPVARVDTEDAFGNPVARVQIDRPHDALIVDAHMEIEVRMRPPRKAEDSQPWRGLRESLRYSAQALTVEELEVRRYLSESPYVRVKRRFSEFAADCFPADAPVLACAEKLMHKIHAEFTYAPGETEVATPLVEVLGQKRGVCQDYCARDDRVPARAGAGGALRQRLSAHACRSRMHRPKRPSSSGPMRRTPGLRCGHHLLAGSHSIPPTIGASGATT